MFWRASVLYLDFMVHNVSFGVTAPVFETGMFAKDTIAPVSKRRRKSQIVTIARRYAHCGIRQDL